MTTAHESLTLQLLEWIGERPRSYAELMEAWRTTCPRMAIWEDACAEGLIASEPGPNGVLRATAKGQHFCREHRVRGNAAHDGGSACAPS